FGEGIPERTCEAITLRCHPRDAAGELADCFKLLRLDQLLLHPCALVNGPLEALLVTALLGNVLMRGNPPAILEHFVIDLDVTSIPQLPNTLIFMLHANKGVGHLTALVAEIDSQRLLLGTKCSVARPRLGVVGAKPIDLRIGFVAHDQPLELVKHAESLR